MDNIPENFQKLTAEDKALYGSPELIYLNPPIVNAPLCIEKRENWIKWRAAPYPAQRHSEYLYIPNEDKRKNIRILISAVMQTPESIDSYISTIQRKRRYDILGKKALSKGYTARSIRPADFNKDIWEIIHSSNLRQGRPIAPLYLNRPPDYGFPSYKTYANPNYDDICCGVFSPDEKLAAYLLGKRVGHHVQYDEIMGHSEHVQNDIMYLLHITFLKLCIQCDIPPQCLNYGPWYSGENPFSPEGGLNRWKRKVRFKPAFLILASY